MRRKRPYTEPDRSEAFYMTKDCKAEHLLIDPSDYCDMNAPWYELHLYDDNTYDSFQKGYKWSDRKPITELGLSELGRLVEDGSFSIDIADATIISLASCQSLNKEST